MEQLFNNLKREERRTFPKHFLASVHCEVRAAGICSILEKKESLKKILFELGFTQCQDINHIQMGGLHNVIGEPVTLTQKLTPLGFKFIDPDLKCEIHLTKGTITISDFAYESIDKFLIRFQNLFTRLKTVLDISEKNLVEKVGLRKINSIIIKPVTNIVDFLDIFNPNLFGIARSGLIPLDSFSISEESIVLEKQEQVSIIRTKLTKQGVDALEANLDFDLISRAESSFEEVFSTLKSLNKTHFDLFMWAITKKMIESMEML